MQIIEVVLSNAGGEIGRYETPVDEFGDVNLLWSTNQNPELAMALEMLRPGDTLQIVERWTERD